MFKLPSLVGLQFCPILLLRVLSHSYWISQLLLEGQSCPDNLTHYIVGNKNPITLFA